MVVKNSNTPYKTPLIPVSAYKIEFDIRTAIPTLQNTFDSGIKKEMWWWWGWWWWWWWGGERIKAVRNRVYLKAAADDKQVHLMLPVI